MTASELRDFGSRYTAAWCSQVPARVASFYAENGSLTINGSSPSVGRAAISAAAQEFMTAFPDMVVTMDGVSLEGDRGHLSLDFDRHEHWTRWHWQGCSHQRLRGVEVRCGRLDCGVTGTFRRARVPASVEPLTRRERREVRVALAKADGDTTAGLPAACDPPRESIRSSTLAPFTMSPGVLTLAGSG